MLNASDILAYMRAKGYEVFPSPGHFNIVYIEGMNPDGTLNPDKLDGWNDLRIVIDHTADGEPFLKINHIATTEPGAAATFSPEAAKRGGVARIAFGQYRAWQVGFHKQSRNGKNHPALVQRAPVAVHRDKNRDGIRTRDNVHIGMFGINQHSTRPGFSGGKIGMFSEGCLVGWRWNEHVDEFIPLVKTDPRFVADADFMFTTTIIAGDDFVKFLSHA